MPDKTNLSKQEAYIQPREMKADLDFLVDNLKHHPQLYFYTPEAAYDHLWSAANEMTKEKQTLKKFYGIIAPIVEKIHCSHTLIRIPKKYLENQNEYSCFLPLNIYAVENRLYNLNCDPGTKEHIPPGSEIISINHIPAATILERLTSFIPAEGSVQTSKYIELNKRFKEYLNILIDTDTFRIEYKDKDGIHKVKVKAVTAAFTESNPGAAMAVPLEFFLDEERKTGFIRMPSFAVMDMNSYMSRLDSVFLSLRQQETDNLVLDLRDNPGGHPIFAAQLFSYLTRTSFTYFKRNSMVNEFEPLYNPMQANPMHFEGKLLVMVNGGCLSTTGHLISLLDYHTDAVFIGEMPGSTYICSDFSRQFTLPNSGIEVNIPGTTFETAISEEAKQIPFDVDYHVVVTANDLIKGIDPYYERIDELILSE